jgi:hypothetical protein
MEFEKSNKFAGKSIIAKNRASSDLFGSRVFCFKLERAGDIFKARPFSENPNEKKGNKTNEQTNKKINK